MNTTRKTKLLTVVVVGIVLLLGILLPPSEFVPTSTDGTSTHETCQEYFERRLSEGWAVVERDGFNVVIQSPEGILRPIDLRNDVETLRPTGAGALTQCTPVGGTNWENVDEAGEGDGGSTYNKATTGVGKTDLFTLPAHSLTGTINSVTVYARGVEGENNCEMRVVLRTHDTDYSGLSTDWSGTWSLKGTTTWTDNPNTELAWTYQEITDLQIGYGLWEDTGDDSKCTQSYVEIDYTPATAPAITINAATNVAATTARLNSTVTDDGYESCDVRWGYGDETQTAENFTSFDTVTDWDETGYAAGQHPYHDASDLAVSTEYFFRVQVKNSHSTVTSGVLTFTTESGVGEPTNLKSFPSATQVVLSWTKGVGATDTLIRYSEAAYPTTTTNGVQAYLGTSSSCTHEDLLPGHTYYYSAWGKSGATYSTSYTTVMATTLAATDAGEVPSAPDMPPTWFQTPDYEALSELPFYDVANAFFDSYEMPRASGWFFTAIFGCIVFGILVLAISKHPMPPLIAVAVALAVVSLIKLVPMWMMAFAVIFLLGALQLGRAR